MWMMWSVIFAWLIKIDDGAQKDLAKLDKHIAKRITAFLRERVAMLDDPFSLKNKISSLQTVYAS